MKVLSGIRGCVPGFRPKQGYNDLKKAGYQYLCLDLNLFCSEQEILQMGKPPKANEQRVRDPITEKPELMLEYPQTLIQSAKDYDLQYEMGVSVIHPYGERSSDCAEFIFDVTISALKLCRQAGCPYLLVYPVSHDQMDLERVTKWYERLIPEAKEQQVTILISNQVKYSEGHWVRGIFAEAEELSAWIDAENEKAGHEAFAVCLDTGSTNLCGQDNYELIRVLGSRIKAVIIRENNGHDEFSLMPFSYAYSKPDYMGLIRGLREIDFDGLLWIDAAHSYASYSTMVRPALMNLIKETGDFLAWQIGMEQGLKRYPNRVLFGAGNMCRNYMKCYGESYPPLFTCDNNQSLWGEEFCGLTIKDPKELLSIPKDCVIYICNTYYREIDAQLREMGVTNPIEYFNDEYLPSYHMDRIARKSDVGLMKEGKK